MYSIRVLLIYKIENFIIFLKIIKMATKRTYTQDIDNTNNKKQCTPLNPDLVDIKNQYLDPISYLKLISVKPEEFNPKIISSIINNFESQFPLSLFTHTFKKAKELSDSYEDIRADPICITSLILRNISQGCIDENDDVKQKDIQTDLENYLEENGDIFYDSPYNVLDDDMDDDLYNKLTELPYDQFKYVCEDAFNKLKNDNPHVYDTMCMNIYSAELIPYFKKIMDE